MKQQIVGDKLFEMVREVDKAGCAVVYVPSPFYGPNKNGGPSGYAHLKTGEAIVGLRGNGNTFTVDILPASPGYQTFYIEGIAKVAEVPSYEDRFAARFKG